MFKSGGWERVHIYVECIGLYNKTTILFFINLTKYNIDHAYRSSMRTYENICLEIENIWTLKNYEENRYVVKQLEERV